MLSATSMATKLLLWKDAICSQNISDYLYGKLTLKVLITTAADDIFSGKIRLDISHELHADLNHTKCQV